MGTEAMGRVNSVLAALLIRKANKWRISRAVFDVPMSQENA
jgi:hypothetical protein